MFPLAPVGRGPCGGVLPRVPLVTLALPWARFLLPLWGVPFPMVPRCPHDCAIVINSPHPTPNRVPSNSGAARAEAKLVWIMPSRDRAKRSQVCLNGRGASRWSSESRAKLAWAMPSRDRGSRSQGGRFTKLIYRTSL